MKGSFLEEVGRELSPPPPCVFRASTRGQQALCRGTPGAPGACRGLMRTTPNTQLEHREGPRGTASEPGTEGLAHGPQGGGVCVSQRPVGEGARTRTQKGDHGAGPGRLGSLVWWERGGNPGEWHEEGLGR